MLSQRAAAITASQTSGMRNRARKLKAEGVKVVNFAAGELDQDTSKLVKDAAHTAIDTGKVQYTDTMGIKDLRECLAAKVSQKTRQTYVPEEVGFTAGAKQALFHAVFAAFGPGDEVLIPAPYWVTFPEQVRLAGATPVFVATAHHGFQINFTELMQHVTERTRGILLNTPHNPTGVIYSPEVLGQIGRLCVERKLTCIFDECYDELVYAPAVHHNIVSLVPEARAVTVLIGSLSKTYCMAGWRAGYIAGPAPFIKAVSNVQSHTASNPCNLVQYAALAALSPQNDSFVTRIRELLSGQRETALAAISRIPDVSCIIPTGAFYLFPDVSRLLGKSIVGQRLDTVDVLAEMLLQHAHIAVVPGSAFGSPHHIRISYAIPGEDIARGLHSFDTFVRSLT